MATNLLCWSDGPNQPTWPFPAVRQSSGRRAGSSCGAGGSCAAARLRLCPRVCRRACQVWVERVNKSVSKSSIFHHILLPYNNGTYRGMRPLLTAINFFGLLDWCWTGQARNSLALWSDIEMKISYSLTILQKQRKSNVSSVCGTKLNGWSPLSPFKIAMWWYSRIAPFSGKPMGHQRILFLKALHKSKSSIILVLGIRLEGTANKTYLLG